MLLLIASVDSSLYIEVRQRVSWMLIMDSWGAFFKAVTCIFAHYCFISIRRFIEMLSCSGRILSGNSLRHLNHNRMFLSCRIIVLGIMIYLLLLVVRSFMLMMWLLNPRVFYLFWSHHWKNLRKAWPILKIYIFKKLL